MLSFFQKLFSTVRRIGLRRTVKRGWQILLSRWEKDPFDAKYGTDTVGIVPLWQLNIRSDNVRFGTSYQACDGATFEEVMRLLDVDPARFTFVDLGCGKGRPLLMASRYAFRKLVGVEFSPQLAATAQANLLKLGVDRAEVLTMDAASYAFPEDNLIVFFYNAFQPEVLSKVIDNLVKVTRHDVRFVYVRPEFADFLENNGKLRRTGESFASVPVQIWEPVREARVVG